MTVRLLSEEEKKRILKTLEVDEEFRLAVAGLIGLKEVIEELRKLREDFNRFAAEQEKRWEENNRRWEEAYRRFEVLENELKKLREDFNRFVEEDMKRWEENNRRWEENYKRWEENSKLWEENFRRWRENDKRWEEAYKRFERIEATLAEHSKYIAELTKAIGELKASLGSIGRRWGRDLELLVLNLYRDAVERFGIDVERIEKVSLRDYEGKYLQRGAKIELDIYMSDKVVYLIEVKSFVDEDDVEWFNARCEIFAKEKNLKDYRKLIVAVNIFKEALERARELGIDVVYGTVVE